MVFSLRNGVCWEEMEEAQLGRIPVSGEGLAERRVSMSGLRSD